MPYATRSDLFMHGLPPDVLVPSSRVVSAIDPVTNLLTLSGHGFADGDLVQFEVQGGDLPGGLSVSLVYVVRPVANSESLFGLALTAGGELVDITSEGTGVTSVVASTSTKVAAILQAASDEIDKSLVAHAVPLPEPYPPIVVQWCAKIAAASLMTALGLANPRWKESAEAILAEATRVRQDLVRHQKGVPLHNLAADSSPKVAEAGAVVVSGAATDSRGWNPSGCSARIL